MAQFALGMFLAACTTAGPTDAPVTLVMPATRTPLPSTRTPDPQVPEAIPTLLTPEAPPNLWVDPASVVISPENPRAGDILEVAFAVHNDGSAGAQDVRAFAMLWPKAATVGLSLEATALVQVPSQGQAEVRLELGEPVEGVFRLWVTVNRGIRIIIEDRVIWEAPNPDELNPDDNLVETDVEVGPFEAYTSDACPAGVNLAVSEADVEQVDFNLPPGVPPPPGGFPNILGITVRNTGNLAMYRVPVSLFFSETASLLRRSGALPPCGGTTLVTLTLTPEWRNLTVVVNPVREDGAIPEDDYSDNEVTVDLTRLPTSTPVPTAVP